jgi:actin-related protein 5
MDTPMQDAEPENTVPPAQLYHPREAHFEKFIEPRPDGYQKAKSRSGDRAAIVIDNGISTPSLRRHQVHIY